MRYAQQHELCNSKARTTRERPTQRTMQCASALEQHIAIAVCARTGTTHCQSSVHWNNALPEQCASAPEQREAREVLAMLRLAPRSVPSWHSHAAVLARPTAT